MADVFISYKSERRAAAEHLAEILTDYGYSVWWDYGLISGRDFGAQIEKELRGAKAVVVLWCSMSVGSEWVREEAALAKRLDRVIPTFIEKNVDLPLGFSLSQTLDLADWDGSPKSARLDRLLRDIGAFVGRAPKPNMEGLERTERAWRRFGAPPLREFALIDALERKLPPRTLPGALFSQNDAREPAGGRKKPHLALFAALGVAALAIVGLVGWGWSATRHPVETAADLAQEAHVQTAPPPARQSQTFRDCADCPEMVRIPSGTFTMGSPASENGHESDETQHTVTVAAFAAGRTEVTRGQWAAFVAATGRPDPQVAGNTYCTWRSPGYTQDNSHPVVCVNWDDAQAYVAWLSQGTGQRYRLLSEAEWEYAARGGDRAGAYWWGESASHEYANFSGTSGRDQWDITAPVGQFPANPLGIYDMHGNVWGWVQTCYDNSENDTNCSVRVVRGGAWGYDPWYLRSATRGGYAPSFRDDNLGFRVARTT